jgi:poly(3-hydroxybutyrate) depolymerase
MADVPATKGRPARLWLLVVVLALAAAGAWYSTHRRSTEVAEHAAVGGGRDRAGATSPRATRSSQCEQRQLD